VLLPSVSLLPLMLPTMRIMRCAVAVKKQDDVGLTNQLRCCAFGYRAVPVLRFAAACGRRSGATAIDRAFNKVVRAPFCLHLPAALPCRAWFAQQKDSCITLQSLRSC